MKFKFGFLAVKKPIDEMFEAAKEAGIFHIEIDLLSPHSYIESFDAKRILRIKKLSQKYNISISLHTSWTINPSEPILLIRKANVEYLKKCVLLAYKLNATHITTHIGYFIGLSSWEWMRKQALDKLILSLREIIPLCRKYKVYLALENVYPLLGYSEIVYLGDNVRDFEYIYSKVKSRHLKLCLDTGHANIGEGPIKYVKKFSKKLVSVHFHDNKGKHDEHLAVDKGTINWRNLANEFKKIKFYGPFVSEVFFRTPQEAREDLKKYFLMKIISVKR